MPPELVLAPKRRDGFLDVRICEMPRYDEYCRRAARQWAGDIACFRGCGMGYYFEGKHGSADAEILTHAGGVVTQ